MSNKPETVFTLTYRHRHGVDVGVYRSEAGAINAAHQLAFERSEEWENEEDKERFQAEEDTLEALNIFDDIEMGFCDSESLEILEAQLRD